MMINWRNGKSGFVGGLKHLIKGVFQYSYSITSATVIPPEVAVSSKFKIDFPPQDRQIAFAFEDRTIVFPPNNRDINI